jgi:hypothetical protein
LAVQRSFIAACAASCSAFVLSTLHRQHCEQDRYCPQRGDLQPSPQLNPAVLGTKLRVAPDATLARFSEQVVGGFTTFGELVDAEAFLFPQIFSPYLDAIDWATLFSRASNQKE